MGAKLQRVGLPPTLTFGFDARGLGLCHLLLLRACARTSTDGAQGPVRMAAVRIQAKVGPCSSGDTT